MLTRSIAAFAVASACFAGGTATAATCRLTVEGVPVVDGEPCSVAARGNDARVLIDGGGTVTVRRSAMSARLPGRPRPDGRRRVFGRAFGQVVASSDPDDSTCYFNQKATLCIEP